MALTKMYLFLASRDKSDVKLLMVVQGDRRSGRVDDLKSLGLSADDQALLTRAAHDNRMYYDVMIEPADSYHQLKQKLVRRGYRTLPVSSNTLVAQMRGQVATTGRLPGQRRAMLQRKS